MKPQSVRFWKVVSLTMVLCVSLLVAWDLVSAGPTAPDLAVSPGYEQTMDAGETVTYAHTITNTGDVTEAITVDPYIPDGWTIAYVTGAHPGGTTIWQPFSLSVGMTATLGVQLTAPTSAASGRYTSTITVTMLSSPTVHVPVYEITEIRPRYLYLPLVTRSYDPWSNGSFEQALMGWEIREQPLPVQLVRGSASEPDGGTLTPNGGDNFALLGNPDYPCGPDGVPLGFASLEQTFSVAPDVTKLAFDYVVWSQDASVDEKYDRFEVYIWVEGEQMPGTPAYYDGNTINEGLGCDTWWRVPEAGWKTGEIDLTPYRGEMVTVAFRDYSRYDGWYNTYVYLDNVRVE